VSGMIGSNRERERPMDEKNFHSSARGLAKPNLASPHFGNFRSLAHGMKMDCSTGAVPASR
jgi:hypothetical protein